VWHAIVPTCIHTHNIYLIIPLIFHLRAAAGVQAKEQNVLMDETTQSRVLIVSHAPGVAITLCVYNIQRI